MAIEYKLSYTANEINNKLGQIDNLSEEINQLFSEIVNLDIPTITQEAGESESLVMSQKAVTEAIEHAVDDITIPTKVSDLTNDRGFITDYTETDPTVPAWAKAASKPSYTKSEVGLGNVDNVKQYSASNPPPYPVTKVNNKTGVVTLSASDVGADASGTASSVVSSHNTSTSAHADIREQINQLSSEKVVIEERVTALENGGISTETDINLPDYWESYLPDKITAIKALQDEGGKDCFSFVVMTDTHVCCQEGYEWMPISPTIAKKVADECDIKYILHLGDVNQRGCYSAKWQLERDNLWINDTMFKPIRDRLLQTQGNHDGNYGNLDRDGDGTISNYSNKVLKNVEDRETFVYSLTDGEKHRQIYRKVGLVGDVHFDESGTGYWIDDVSNKVRYILLNTHNTKYELRDDGTQKYPSMWLFRFQQSQYDMVIEALNSVPSDSWAVVVGGHVPLDKSGEVTCWGGTNDDDSDCGLMKKMLTAYKNKTEFSGVFDGTAESSSIANFTNKADVSDSDFLDGSYMNANGVIGNDSTYFVTNYISAVCPNKTADIIRVSGFDTSEPLRVAVYKEDKTLIVGTSSNLYSDITIDDNGVATWKAGYVNNYVSTANANNIAYIRVSGKKKTTASDIVVTVNEEITYTEGEASGDGYDSVSVDCDFTSAKGNLVGFFGGHKHVDESYADGIDIIISRCDGFKQENTTALRDERVEGTYTEYSFDVFTVNKKTGVLYATKIGAGTDREIELI